MSSGLNIADVPWNTHPENNQNNIPEHFDVCDELSFRVISRIGSASVNGRVYEVEQTNTHARVALKFMTVNNEHECRLASYLGSLNPLYFPRVVSWQTCPNVIVREENQVNSDAFIEHAERQFIKSYIIENMIGTAIEKKRMRINLRNIHGTNNSIFRQIRDLGVSHEIIQGIQAHRGIAMTVMASELMSGDFATFIKENPRSTEIPRLIGEVFAGLRTLVREQIVHEDLHLGNVLIRSDVDGNLTAVIHDFGESTTDRSPYEHIKDIVKFLDSLIYLLPREYEEIIASSRIMVDDIQIRKGNDIDANDMKGLLRNLQNHFSSI